MQKISGGVWKPINDVDEIEAQDGSDIITTIDVNIQDVAENALAMQLIQNDADHGCVVLMEVETGERIIRPGRRGEDASPSIFHFLFIIFYFLLAAGRQR